MKLSDFRAGDYVQLHPACNLWMQGARYVDILKVGRKYLTVRRPDEGVWAEYRVLPQNVLEIVNHAATAKRVR